jgi:hypothetical protein
VLIGDGIKAAKEANFMPGVKKLHQESENSGKAPWIFGHHFGVVGMLAGITEKIFCIPLAAELHEGALALRSLQGKKPPTVNGVEKTTVVTLMGELLAIVTRTLAEPCVAVLDAFFAAAPMFSKLPRRRFGKTASGCSTSLHEPRTMRWRMNCTHAPIAAGGGHRNMAEKSN